MEDFLLFFIDQRVHIPTTTTTILYVRPSLDLPFPIGNYVFNNREDNQNHHNRHNNRQRIGMAVAVEPLLWLRRRPPWYFNPSHDSSPRCNLREWSTFPLTMTRQQQQLQQQQRQRRPPSTTTTTIMRNMLLFYSQLLMKIPVPPFKSIWGMC